METNVQTARVIPLWKIIYKNLFLIILATAIGLGAGLTYALLRVKPVYTAQNSVILRTVISDTSATENTDNANLAKRYLPTVAQIVVSPEVVLKANKAYEALGGKPNSISISKFAVSYGEDSLIFSISYSDKNKIDAVDKLTVLIESAVEVLKKPGYVEAEIVDLIPTQRGSKVSSSSNFTSCVVLGTLAGLAISVIGVIVAFILDNNVRSKAELEELTGASVLAMLE